MPSIATAREPRSVGASTGPSGRSTRSEVTPTGCEDDEPVVVVVLEGVGNVDPKLGGTVVAAGPCEGGARSPMSRHGSIGARNPLAGRFFGGIALRPSHPSLRTTEKPNPDLLELGRRLYNKWILKFQNSKCVPQKRGAETNEI